MQGQIQAVTTIVLVGVTAWYVPLTRQMVQATRTSQRPYVYVDITSERGGSLELGVGNYGERAAERRPASDDTPKHHGADIGFEVDTQSAEADYGRPPVATVRREPAVG